MTIEELEAKGFRFFVTHYEYRVTYPKKDYFNRVFPPMMTISHVTSHIPDSKANRLECARMDALLYYVRERLR